MKEKEGKKMAAPIYEQLQQRKKEIEKKRLSEFETRNGDGGIMMFCSCMTTTMRERERVQP